MPPPPDRPGLGDDAPPSTFEAGNPDAVPSDVTESQQYQEESAEVRRQVKSARQWSKTAANASDAV